MAGKITVSTINDSSGVLATQNGMTGIAKAWVRYNGVAQTITSSFNISSVTYSAAGTYIVNFTTAMPNANYCMVATSGDNNGGGALLVATNKNTAPTASSATIYTLYTVSLAAYDRQYIMASFFSS